MNEKMQSTYHQKFHACKRSWIMGLITGVPVSAGIALLSSGFQLDPVFFIVLPFALIASIWIMATVFALNYTSEFGCSCISWTIFRTTQSAMGLFTGVPILLWVALLLFCIGGTFWLFGLVVFAGLFPIETLYYAVRCMIEKSIHKQQ